MASTTFAHANLLLHFAKPVSKKLDLLGKNEGKVTSAGATGVQR
ncbi:hypothetical protein MTYM_00512 [Methylococcales bacterium]|nr:hypothetical protein MTYM_00512 [Methylococcales bacterium]